MQKIARIYNIRTGYIITDGLQSATVSDEAIQAARRIARDRGYPVIVEDYGVRKLYCVSPSGRKYHAPKWWSEPDWTK